MLKILFAVAVSAILSGTALAQTASLQVKDAWARATPAGAQNGAAYATIESATADRLIGASSPVANKAELHKMTMAGNIMKMRQVAGIDLPAGKPVTLKPGGFHIMLLGLKQPLHPGDKIPLTLTFAKAATRRVEAAVGSVGAMGPAGTKGMPMTMPAPAPAHK